MLVGEACVECECSWLDYIERKKSASIIEIMYEKEEIKRWDCCVTWKSVFPVDVPIRGSRVNVDLTLLMQTFGAELERSCWLSERGCLEIR